MEQAREPPKLGHRAGWRPAGDDDYGDGGAFPEIPVDQYPSGIGSRGPLVPLTFVSGFLGSGKTTMLKYVLENQDGKRVGVVVNDVAEVNIDAKLLARRQMADEDEAYEDTVELENGCACCTAGPDLMDSILKLVRLSLRRDITYDRIVVEMSGVAEPRNLCYEFQDARESHQVFKYVDLQTMLTVVDSSHFLQLYASKSDIKQLPSLVMTTKEMEGGEAHIDSQRRVVDLLVEMIECADFVVLNKTDRVPEERKRQLMDIIHSLNPSAASVACTWGKVPYSIVLGAPKGVGVAKMEDSMKEDIKRAVLSSRHGGINSRRRMAVEEEASSADSIFGAVDLRQSAGTVESSARGLKGGLAGPREMPDAKRSKLPTRQQTSAADRFGISTFVYSRRRPFHPRRLVQLLKLLPVKVDADNQVTDTWQLPSSLSAAAAAAAASSDTASAVSATADAPGAAGRVEGESTDVSGEASAVAAQGTPELTATEAAGRASLHAVIRSKGFVWLANAPKNLNYWSHAGHFFSLESLHEWWITTPIHEWPGHPDEIQKILDDFSRPEAPPMAGDARAMQGLQVPSYAGDRRQEIVFIGIDMDQEAIENLMDECLLSDEEMTLYNSQISAHDNCVIVDWNTKPPAVVGVPGRPSPQA